MTINPYALGALSQVSYLTDDIQEALSTLHKTIPSSSFFQMHELELTNQTYSGIPSAVRMHSAVAWTGSIFLEIIQPLTSEPLFIMQERAGMMKLHHLGFVVEDWGQIAHDLELQGMLPLFKGEITGLVRSGFFDTVTALGHYVELLEVSSQGMQVFEAIRNGTAG